MTTARDFVRPSYYTEQHQAFLDKLASNGSAELVWLFEELLEEFELGPAAAERIVRYWRASR